MSTATALRSPPETSRDTDRLLPIAAKVAAGARLTREDGIALVGCHDLAFLGELATLVRDRKRPERTVSYIVDRNINPTNVCVARCTFCAFDRLPGDPEGYVLTHEQIFAKVDELLAVPGVNDKLLARGGVQVLLQGGHHPKLGIEYYEQLFRALRTRYPKLHLHGLSPSEIVHVSKLSHLTIEAVVERLTQAGLDSIPGGGGEILVDRVRQLIAPGKANTAEWLGVMRVAHQRGMMTTATMMYGHVETEDERVDHLLALRALQDESLAAGKGSFTAFICWPFQPGGSELECRKSGANDFLRTNAVARVLLDNFPHQQTSFVTQGDKLGQLALFFGCDDFGGTMLEENVVSAAGTQCLITIQQIEHCIRAAGFTPVRRNMHYEMLDS
ncbi:MAG: dehypoxanthine futalosine cyclase [Planctomycetes bacterium]|nr:dehypoxanthine futalosine cyclase [Planctomycetota bacterium]